MKWKCKHCTQEFDFSRTTEKANHSRHCSSNPKKQESYQKIKERLQKYNDDRLGPKKEFDVVCHRCGVHFLVCERENRHPEKVSYFCSRRCANSSGGQAKALKYHPDDTAHYTTIAWRHHEKKCVVCDEQLIVAVHHYDENHHNNDPANLVPMCPTHHQYMHSRFKSMISEVVDSYVEQFRGPRCCRGTLGLQP